MRFRLAETVYICSDPMLKEAFGYDSATNMADAILARTYVYPPNIDQATREICKECARIRMMIPTDSVSTHLSKEDWQYQWKGRRESTSSSDGFHFGHYIAGIQSDHISHFHALKVTLGVVHARLGQNLV